MGHPVAKYWKHWLRYSLALVVGIAVSVGVACEGSGPGGPSGAISLAITPTSASVAQGASTPVTATVTRSGGFTGGVTFSVTGAPTGVTAVVTDATTTGTVTTATVTVQVAAATALGVHSITVRATGTGVTAATATFALTVTAGSGFTLTLSSSAVTIAPGDDAPITVNIGRTNFTADVGLTLEGAPAGVTGAFDPTPATGATSSASTLTISVGAAVAVGTYNLTVRGIATGHTDLTAALVLTVSTAASYTLSLDPAALSIVQGASATTTVDIARSNFTGAVTLSLGGEPAGVTGAFDPAAPTGTTSTLTVSVGASVAPGVYNLTVDGTGTPGDRSTPLVLTVTAAASYTLSLTPTSLSIAQGANAPTTVNIARTNFTLGVTLTLEGAPAGVTGAFDPTPATGAASTLTVSVGAAVAAGTYNLTVRGTATGLTDRTAALTLTVTTSGGGGAGITLNYANCEVADRPVWLAYQDGTGAWTRVTGTADVYTFNIASGRGGFAAVELPTAGTSAVAVQYFTTAQFTGTIDVCPTITTPTTKSINGTVAGISGSEVATISLGGGTVSLFSFSPTFPNFVITGVLDGTHDLMALRRADFTGPADRVILRRDLNIPNDGMIVGTLDFDDAEAFEPISATITVGGLVGGETLIEGVSYNTGASCIGTSFDLIPDGAATFTAHGVPGAEQRASDYHSVFIAASNGTTESRTVSEYFHTLGARTVALGATLPTPTITTLAGSYKRLQAAYTIPGDYAASPGSFGYDDGGDKSVGLFASSAYLGGMAVTLALPDFSALAGWDNDWAPASSSTGAWNIFAFGATGLTCTENGRSASATLSGTH